MGDPNRWIYGLIAAHLTAITAVVIPTLIRQARRVRLPHQREARR